jgi:hypothetical protein
MPSERTSSLTGAAASGIVISKVKAWDGKDASPPVEETLDLDSDDLTVQEIEII